jgi:predicted ArsR family transcriptional regulator
LKISRPALGKHVRTLINEGLVKQKHVVEGGTAKAVYELTDFGKKIIEKVRSFTEDMEAMTSKIIIEVEEELMEVNVQISSMKAILKGLEKRMNNNEISPQDYSSLKSDYDKKLDSLKKREKELKQRLDKK